MKKVLGLLIALILGFAATGSTFASQSTTKQSANQKQEQQTSKKEKKKKKHSKKKKNQELNKLPPHNEKRRKYKGEMACLSGHAIFLECDVPMFQSSSYYPIKVRYCLT